jgi:threonine dehydrogenase-like Zn-dependent dehydrogenase
VKAVVFHGKDDVRVDNVPDPRIIEPTDAIIRVTSTAICGSDLHLFGDYVLKLEEGDILGHEPMGIVEEVGSAVTDIAPGDRVVIPFNVSCGSCFMCEMDLYSQCETTASREHGKGAALFGYTHLYGGVDGGQAEYLRVPQAHFGPVKVDHGPPDERFLFLSDVLPTAWQAVRYADVPDGGTLGVWGLGPIGQMCCRIGRHLGAERVIGVDFVPERIEMARRWGVEVVDVREVEDAATAVNEMTGGRGCDAVIDAVGMESGDETFLAKIAQRLMIQADRLEALRTAQGAIRRGGTLSISGVYLGLEQNFPLGDLFDRQIQIRMGQANVKRWVPEILPLLTDEDPLGTGDLVTHRLPLDQAPHGYEIFREKEDGAIKVVLDPAA